MEPTNLLKVLITLSAVEVSNFYLANRLIDRTEEQIKIDSINKNIILSIRAIILIFFSIKFKCPIPTFASITVIITILIIVLRTNTNDETSTDKVEN